MYFKSFYAANRSIISSRFRAPSKKERIIHDLAYLAWKKIEKDYAKSKIQNHQCKGFGLDFSDLIHSHIYAQWKPNAKHTEAAHKA